MEIEGLSTGLRFDDIKLIFEAQRNFSPTSAVARRIKSALDFLATSFPEREPFLKNRTVVQSVITFTCRLIETEKFNGLEPASAGFIRQFMKELGRQVELGQAATDFDYIRFQKSINANVKAGARIRHEILMRKAFMYDSGTLANIFDPAALVSSGISGRVTELANSIADNIGRINAAYAATHGEDLFKATNKTTEALRAIGKPINSMKGYSDLMGNLYFLFRESIGQRLGTELPQSFIDVNALRTDLQHDVDHGDRGKVAAKRRKIGSTFEKYSGVRTPQVLDSERFMLVQANLLSAIELDLLNLAAP